MRCLVRSRGLGDVYKRQGRDYIPYSDVRWALRFTELEEEVDALPQGLKTHAVSYTPLTLPTSDLV